MIGVYSFKSDLSDSVDILKGTALTTLKSDLYGIQKNYS